MFVLNNRPSTDNYSDTNTLDCPGAVKVNLIVANAAVYMQFSDPAPGMIQGGASYGPERFFAPGFHNLVRRCERVRFRSVVSGAPAQVTIEALTLHD